MMMMMMGSVFFFCRVVMMMMVGVFIKYEGRWLVVAPKKVNTHARTHARDARTGQITYTTEARRPITQRTKYTPLGKEGIEQSSPPPPSW